MTKRNVVTSMPESFGFRKPFRSQRVHGSQTLLKRPLQHLYPNFLLIYNKWTWKLSLLVRFQILGLFGNTLTANHMYSRHRWEKYLQQIQTLLYRNRKSISGKFIAFLESTQNPTHFEKKRSASYVKYFKSYWPREMWLLHFPNAPVLEHPSTVKIFTGPKHCWNLYCSIFIPIFH